MAAVLAQSNEFASAANVCSPGELSEVLFRFGLTWKEGRQSRSDFRTSMQLCVRACCQLNTLAKGIE
jgi:hypothetical protein